MLELPLELLDLIISAMDTNDPCAVVQVSRTFRELSKIPLLLRYNISTSEIYSGSITIPSAAAHSISRYFLVDSTGMKDSIHSPCSSAQLTQRRL